MTKSKLIVRDGGWRQGTAPVERLSQDVAGYCEAVIYALGAEYAVMDDVREARAVPKSHVMQVLRRSSAETLLAPVLRELRDRGLIRMASGQIYFLPALIERWANQAAEVGDGEAAPEAGS